MARFDVLGFRGRRGGGRSGLGGHAGSFAGPAFYAHRLPRRALLGWAFAGSWLGWALAARAQRLEASDEMRQRIADVIAEYDQQGEHRTATRSDEVSARWLLRELAGCGLRGRLEPFELLRFDQRRADVICSGATRHGLAAFDGGTTGPEGVVGRLGPLGSGAEIAVARIAPAARGAAEAFQRARSEGAHRAIVVLPERGEVHGDLALINAERFANPDVIPIVQLAGSHTLALEEGARAGAACRVIVEADRSPATAYNVTARISGASSELAPLVVMTPRSGWWSCASERGGGLAAFLEIARALAERVPARDVVFLASSGHELGHLGLHAWLGANPGLARGAKAFLHLGANFVAAGGQVVVQPSSPEHAELARAAFARAGRPPDAIVPAGSPPFGEAREIADRPYLSVLGTNPRFHTPDDRWPYAVDLGGAVPLCAALVEIARSLAG